MNASKAIPPERAKQTAMNTIETNNQLVDYVFLPIARGDSEQFVSIGHGAHKHGRCTIERLYANEGETTMNLQLRAIRRVEEINFAE